MKVKFGDKIETYSSIVTKEQPAIGVILEYKEGYYHDGAGIPTEFYVRWDDNSVSWNSENALFSFGTWAKKLLLPKGNIQVADMPIEEFAKITFHKVSDRPRFMHGGCTYTIMGPSPMGVWMRVRSIGVMSSSYDREFLVKQAYEGVLEYNKNLMKEYEESYDLVCLKFVPKIEKVSGDEYKYLNCVFSKERIDGRVCYFAHDGLVPIRITKGEFETKSFENCFPSDHRVYDSQCPSCYLNHAHSMGFHNNSVDKIPTVKIEKESVCDENLKFSPEIKLGFESEKKMVGLPRDLFVKSLKDYSDWETAWVREALQNSVDAGATEVRFKFDEVTGWISCIDNGSGMDRNILENVLLNLGESYKEGENNVGGFGRAKEILFFAHPEWEVITWKDGKIISAEGEFIEYSLNANVTAISPHGTDIRVKVQDPKSFTFAAISYLENCQCTGCKVFVNDEQVKIMRKGKIVKNLGWSRVHGNASKEHLNRIYVRKNGVVMFDRWVPDLEKTVIVEVVGDSTEILTTNRDGLVSEYSHQLDELIAEEFKEKFSDDSVSDVEGYHLSFVGFETASNSAVDDGNTFLAEGTVVDFGNVTDIPFPEYGIPFVFHCNPSTSFDFDNEKVRKIGSMWYELGIEFEKDLKKKRVIGEEKSFAIGFTLDPEAMAAFTQVNNYLVMMVNPDKFKNKANSAIPFRLISSFIHEMSHINVSGHSTNFISEMSGIQDKILDGFGAKKYYGMAMEWSGGNVKPLGDVEVEQLSFDFHWR